ncbi:protein ANTAGONIST OF LIKE HETEROCHROMATIN PROTEIN 1 [Sergentomyia squamirostris]
MSRKYNRVNFLNFLDTEAVLDLLDVEDEEERTRENCEDRVDKGMDDFYNCLALLENHRYLYRSKVAKCLWFEEILPTYDDSRLLQYIRVSREEFTFILHEICTDPVFIAKSGNQMPVEKQLALVLYRLGSFGDSSSIAKIAALFGIGDGGTLDNVTHRVLTAILNLKTKYLNWPNAEERRQIVQNTYHELPGCVGYIDGTELPLAEAPILDPDSYFSRKKRHSIKATIICDYQHRVRYLATGVPGSVHDAKMFANMALGKDPERFLTGSEWIAGDSAYKLTERIITPFRQNSTVMDQRSRAQFNRHFSSFRVRVEQVFGMAKEKFPSLKELRFRLGSEENHMYSCNWVMVYFILYNMLLQFNMEKGIRINFDEFTSEENDNQIEEDITNLNTNDTAERKRQNIYETILRINS